MRQQKACVCEAAKAGIWGDIFCIHILLRSVMVIWVIMAVFGCVASETTP